MCCVRLRVYDTSARPDAHRQYLDPLGSHIVTVPVLRLMTTAVLHAPSGSLNQKATEQDALIDTGMWASTIADGTWQQYETDGLLERLSNPDPAVGIGPVAGPGIRIGGGTARYSWGRLWVRLVDRSTPGDPNRKLLIGAGVGCGCLSLIVGIVAIIFIVSSLGRTQSQPVQPQPRPQQPQPVQPQPQQPRRLPPRSRAPYFHHDQSHQ